jgi:hypothetical protein
MKPYVENSNSGRGKARDEIHHKTSDGGLSNRAAVARSQRKAARRQGKAIAAETGDSEQE